MKSSEDLCSRGAEATTQISDSTVLSPKSAAALTNSLMRKSQIIRLHQEDQQP